MTELEPIAVIGMACRFAGGIDSLDAFWALLREGRDTIGELPPERWAWYATQSPEHAVAVRDVTKRGAFLDDVKGFDAEFFDITPREAALMDPQHRIVLELAWEALEHAGVAPPDLAGTDAGVFVGIGSDDYGRRLLEDLPRVEAWTGIGGAYCAAANRVSYTLDLRGPSMAVDTACSSSLVAIHLAAQALRAGECPVALAGGVLVMAAPGLSLVLDAAGATAPDGRCKSFDAAADGYGRGEGGGMVVLKRLADAERDGDRILALVRGSAVHQDGRTNGIMAPSGPAQAHLLRRVYARAGIDPSTVGYVEAHGTGTPAGDPLEAAAIRDVLAPSGRRGRPLLIGSVKPNVGHLEAGAGVAGVIKAVLALRHGAIPPSLHCTNPNPALDWSTSGLRVATELTPWPPAMSPRRAGVSGYGYGGTIAHVILEEPDRSAAAAPAEPGPALYPLSGASGPALQQYAARLADHLAGTDTPLGDVGYTLARRRAHLTHRRAVYAADRAGLVAGLRAIAGTGPDAPAAVARGLVWVFSGHGSQWTGMGRQMLGEPAFAAVIDEVEPLFRAELGLSVRGTIAADDPQPVEVIQPMIFAIQAALAATWRAHGLRPDAVIGHSVGEIAAAVTAGALTLEQGARLVCRRSVLLREVAGRGAMAMVNLPPEQAERRLGGRVDVAVAVASAAGSAVISGDIAAVEQLTREWTAEGLVVRAIESTVAFHSAQMDPLLDRLAAAAGDLPPSPATTTLYTTALADPRSTAARDGAYWSTNLRGQVRFAAAVAAAVEDGYRLFVEVSPHPVVEHSIVETLAALGVDDAFVTHSLRRNRAERETLLTNLGELYGHGAAVDWSALWPYGRLADLPSTVWQRREHWAEEPPRAPGSLGEHDPDSHTLLGGQISVNGTTRARAWLTRLDRASRPYPGDHPVRDVEIIPAAVLLHTFLVAAAGAGGWPDLADVALRVPVSVTRSREVQVVLQDATIRLSSRIVDDRPGHDRRGDDRGWVPHTSAAVEARTDPLRRHGPRPRTSEELPTGFVVDRLASLGVAAMGFAWTVVRLRRGDAGMEAVVEADPRTWAALLDAALSIASVGFRGEPILRMPAHIGRVSLADRPPARARVEVRRVAEDTVDVQLVDPDGVVAGRIDGLRYGVLDSEVGAFNHPRRLVHRIAWRPAPAAPAAKAGPLVLVGPESPLRRRLIARLRRDGVAYRAAPAPEQLREAELAGGHTILVVPPPGPRGDIGEGAARGAWLLARTAQRIAAARLATPARLWCLTHGVRDGLDQRGLEQAPLWGLGRIIGGEYPDMWGGIVDIGRSPEDVATAVRLLAAAPVRPLAAAPGEDVVAIRGGEPTVARLAPVDGEPLRPPRTCEPDGTYLVTGGLGALGLEVAHWLADRGARRIVLAGRRVLPARDAWAELTDPTQRAQVATVRSLERRGVTVVTVAVDVADADAAAKLLAPAALGLPPIRGVVHAAGVLDSRALPALDEESLRTVLRPKVQGALVLHGLFPPGSVDFFVLFSSCGQLLGLPGQASYAAGNAFLDALAGHRRAAGDPGATSFGWTSWRGLGMSTSSAVIDAELAARGTADISLVEAFGAWELADRYDLEYAAVLRPVALAPSERRPALLRELATSTEDAGAPAPAADAWLGLDPVQLHESLVGEISTQVAAETRLPANELDPRRTLVEMGLDSVMTVRIRRGLERRFRLALPATLFWDRPTIDAVAGLLAERLGGEAERSQP